MEQCVKTIGADNVNDLVTKGIDNIEKHGYPIQALRSGKAMQDLGVNYVLLNPKNRVYNLIPEAIPYLCRELKACFSGTLKARDGLSVADKKWDSVVDEQGNINSNYGYYVFYEKTPIYRNQYEWVINNLVVSVHAPGVVMPAQAGIQYLEAEKSDRCSV